jgi:hypothetical protein
VIRTSALTIAAAALALAATHAAAINKCVDKAGKVSYQDAKCPDDAKQDVLKAPPPPSSNAPSEPAAQGASKASAPGDDPEDPKMLDLVSVQVGYEGCTMASADFASAHAAQYEAWRAANAKLLARLEHSERYQQVLANGRRNLRDQHTDAPAVRDSYLKFCNAQFIPMLIRNTPR